MARLSILSMADTEGISREQPKLSAFEWRKESLRSSRNEWSGPRMKSVAVLESRVFEACIGILIFAHGGFIIYETDLLASGGEYPTWMHIVTKSFLLVYTIELVLRIYTYQRSFLNEGSNVVDLVVVCVDLLAELLDLLSYSSGILPSITVLRAVRLCRLVRFLRVLMLFKELNMMLQSFISALMAMFWATIMLAGILTVLSIAAVEVVHPVVQELALEGQWEGCDRCNRAFSSVAASNLTFLQTIIAGDSWGYMTLPVIERSPLTGILFLSALVMINFGVLNLILTVIVNAAQEARDMNIDERLREKEKGYEKGKAELVHMCANLDKDGNAEISKEELFEGMRTNMAWAKTLALMDADTDEIDIIFEILDLDKSGSVSYEEFAEQLYKIKSQEPRTMLVYIKGLLHNVQIQVGNQMRILEKNVDRKLDQLLDKSRTIGLQSAEPLRSSDKTKDSVFPLESSSLSLLHCVENCAPCNALGQREENQANAKDDAWLPI